MADSVVRDVVAVSSEIAAPWHVGGRPRRPGRSWRPTGGRRDGRGRCGTVPGSADPAQASQSRRLPTGRSGASRRKGDEDTSIAGCFMDWRTIPSEAENTVVELQEFGQHLGCGNGTGRWSAVAGSRTGGGVLATLSLPMGRWSSGRGQHRSRRRIRAPLPAAVESQPRGLALRVPVTPFHRGLVRMRCPAPARGVGDGDVPTAVADQHGCRNLAARPARPVAPARRRRSLRPLQEWSAGGDRGPHVAPPGVSRHGPPGSRAGCEQNRTAFGVLQDHVQRRRLLKATTSHTGRSARG